MTDSVATTLGDRFGTPQHATPRMRWRWRALRPPLPRTVPLWLVANLTVAALGIWLVKSSPSPEPLPTLHILLPPFLMAFLLLHPRARGLYEYGRHSSARRQLQVSEGSAKDAAAHHGLFASGLAVGRVGPVWLRCATAGFVLGYWARELGWLSIKLNPPWMRQPSPVEIRVADYSLFIAFSLGAAALFAEHLALWERLTLTTRWARRGQRFKLFWVALGRAILSQTAVALWSLGALLLLGMALALCHIAWYFFTDFSESPISRWMQTPARARTELLLLILPGMLLSAGRELRLWREDLALRLAVLAREIDRERRGTESGAAHAGSRRRLARGGRAE